MFNIELFYYQNPWHKGKLPQFPYIPRDIMSDLVRWVDERETLVVIGPRQAGKSTLLKALIKFLIEQKKIEGKDIFYFNLDDTRMIKFLSTPEDFIKFIQSFSPTQAYIFIDEAQRLENPGLFLKCVYDLGLNLKLIISGSSSLELKSKIFESLAGRKIVFHLFPFSFREFLKTKPFFSEFKRFNNWDDLAFQEKMHSSSLSECLEEYVIYGGYPRVVLEQNLLKKKELLWEIYSSYVEKDIVNFLKIELPDKFNSLVKVLASQIGGLVNIHELANTLGINRITLQKYISILKQTFVISKVLPFYRNIRSEISKMPKVYFNDTGLRNTVIDSFGEINTRPDRGQLLENFIYIQLKSEFLKDVHFWRTKTGGEVDFVLESAKGIIGFEVKFTSFTKPSFSRSLRHFIRDYSPKKIVIFTKNYLQRMEEENIIFLPSYWLFSLRNILEL